jgi:hypothetical protein
MNRRTPQTLGVNCSQLLLKCYVLFVFISEVAAAGATEVSGILYVFLSIPLARYSKNPHYCILKYKGD